ncbi:MAG: DUF1893 domain-containing protein [Paramuribaculum sp.]|nr:DUF1893 domain-containing protein [Paramuribaculum sp.]MDE6322991.1 DUF1893 domain-containing protein [Paramuribaculum sp.]MDE6487742.1 DUF1893 domain-containing protein [Paramuribaculum sp.]
MTVNEAAEILHARKCSCVICNNGEVTVCNERGVKDLFRILRNNPEILSGATIADKVIGKGAAALMIAGGAAAVYADVISAAAVGLFATAGTSVEFKECVPAIRNRAGTGICPVESLCAGCRTAAECIPLIEQFLLNKPI